MTQAGRQPAPGIRAAGPRILALTLGLIVGLLLAELALRGFGAFGGIAGRRLAARDPLATLYEPFGRYGYRQRPGKIENFPNDTRANYNSMGFRGPLVSVEKPAGVFRIVLLGGSTAIGYGVDDDQTIDSYLRAQLRERFPSACVEVVSLALGGYDSYQDYERFRVDGTRLSPDLVIIHSGINDVRNAKFANLSDPPDPRTLIWETEMRRIRTAGPAARIWAVVKHYSYFARLPGYLQELRAQQGDLQVIRAVEPHDDAVRYFETNLQRTIDTALARGASVLLSVPPSAITLRNKPTDPVEKSYWIKDAGTTEAYRVRLAHAMDSIATAYRQAGRPVEFTAYHLTADMFIDDAHLSASGNETVARGLVQALTPQLERAAAASPNACSR